MTAIIIGILIAGTIFSLRLFGNPLNIIRNFSIFSRNEIYQVSQATDDLPVSREPNETLTLEQFAELRELFENQQFEMLNSILEDYQSGFELNSSDEYKVLDAYRVFAGTLPIYQDVLNRWARRSPEHYAPYLARANYYYAQGWESRGNRFATDTSEDQFRKMRFYFRNAADDLETALHLNQNLLPAHLIQMGIFTATGDTEREDRCLRNALELFPHSFLIRSKYMWGLTPRWGGSYREMENFAAEAEQYADFNPELTALYGFIYFDQSRRLVSRKKYQKAAELCNRALIYGDNWHFYKQRAIIYHYYLQDQSKALTDIDRSIYLRPTMEESYRLRSKIHFKDGDMENALDDLSTAELIKPGDRNTQKWRTWAGENLMKRGHKAFKADLNAAIEHYDLSVRFDPANALAHYWRGVAFYRQKEFGSAVLDFESSIGINPHHFESYLMMDYTLLESQQWDRILGYWNQFIELEPEHARAYLERAGTNYHRKDYASSLNDLRAACDLGNEEGCKRFEKYKNIRQ